MIGPTKAQLSYQKLNRAIAELPVIEQDEILYVEERIHFLIAKYGSSANLAIMKIALQTAVDKGQ